MKSSFTTIVLAASLSLGVVAPASIAAAAEPAKAAAKTTAPKVFTSPQKVGTKATCPVTGEQFSITSSTAHAEYKGKYVYFCCPSCQKKFDKDPEKFTK